MRLALLTLLPLIAARAQIKRQEASPSRSFDAEFPSPTTVGGIPDCADECYEKARAQTSDCPDGSIACLCVQPEVQGFIASCLKSSCATDDLESAAQYGIELCRAAVDQATQSPESAPATTSTDNTPSPSAAASSAPSDQVPSSPEGANGGETAQPESPASDASTSAEVPAESPSEHATPDAASQTDGAGGVVITETPSSTPSETPLTSTPAVSTQLPPTTISAASAAATSAPKQTITVEPTSSPSGALASRPAAVPPQETGRAAHTAQAGIVSVLLAAGVALLL